MLRAALHEGLAARVLDQFDIQLLAATLAPAVSQKLTRSLSMEALQGRVLDMLASIIAAEPTLLDMVSAAITLQLTQ